MTRIDVACDPAGTVWSCRVEVAEGGSATSHVVTVAAADLAQLDPGATDPTDLVRRSFEFMLEHEPKESILRSFELTVIRGYFPDWERAIRR
ncbi:MAG: hypothetical protein ABI628_06410 [Chloroflexota bacterium]